MKLFRNIALSFPTVMWACVAIATGFDVNAMMDVTLTCFLATVAVYFLPHTNEHFEEIDDALVATEAIISRITDRK